MTIYRGPGGTGSATSDADTNLYQQFLEQSLAARDAALAAQTAAELAETNAETAETNAETAETNAANSASSASSSASAAATSASNASSSASAAASSASSASTSATNAANSATAAAASATSAANSASTATTQASNASSSATAAASSASSAATSATNAASSASSASTSATNAANSATSASNSASSAATSATNAANSATSASNSASAAAASASEAAGYAASINPADLVHISGTETITGAKTFSTNPIISSGVANGVCYLNGSKVLTTGSALTFDGTNLGIGTSSPDYTLTANGIVNVGSSGANLGILLAPTVNTALPSSSVKAYVGVTNSGYGFTAGSLFLQPRTGVGASLIFATEGTAKAILDASGNLGIGVTPSAWGSVRAFEVAGGPSIMAFSTNAYYGANYFYNGSSYIYKANGRAFNYVQDSNGHQWFTAPSGTAGNAISFTRAMTLNASGNLGIGTTSPSQKLDVNGATKTSMVITDSSLGFRNRIINGDMRIDQRNNGASVSPSASQYTLDRWQAFMNAASAKYSVQQNAGSVTPPAGFSNYLGATSLGAYTVAAGEIMAFQQAIEGFNIADLGWGTANAQSVTLSFWARSSLTGTFGGAIRQGSGSRSYPFSYTISSANTWEQKTITIPGDTSGTYATNNTAGLLLSFGMGVGSTFSGTAGAWSGSNFVSATGAVSVVGTNGATFYITGVQLEAGSVATPFERRPYGMELALCQRYYEVSPVNAYPTAAGFSGSYYQVTKRVTPSVVQTGGATLTFNGVGVNGLYVSGGATTGYSYTATAEL